MALLVSSVSPIKCRLCSSVNWIKARIWNVLFKLHSKLVDQYNFHTDRMFKFYLFFLSPRRRLKDVVVDVIYCCAFKFKLSHIH